MAVAVDFSALWQNQFWKKKFRKAVLVRDTNKDGCISRADFELMVDHCKKLDSSTPKHLDKFTQYVQMFCTSFGLVDESVKLSYNEFEEKWMGFIKEWVEKGTIDNFFESMFHMQDINEDGFISFEEWTAHYQISGIDTAHARASFDAMDTNHDGKISEDEFVKYHMEYFFSTENKLNSAILCGPLE